MNKYEIVLFIWLSLLTIGFSFIFFEMLDRTKKIKDAVNNLNMNINPQLKRVRTFVLDELRSKQKPRTGYWKNIDSDNAICGCCKCVNLLYGTYCKHCGAKMREVD